MQATKTKSLEKSSKSEATPSYGHAPTRQGASSPLGTVGPLEVQRAAGNLAIQRSFLPGQIQAKLKVGNPDDPPEAQADRTAEHVIQMKAGACACGDGCLSCPTDTENLLMRKPEKRSNGGKPSVPTSAVRGLGRGQPLDAGTRTFMESRFGQDLSGVRIHTGADAARTAHALNARAFTFGHNIAFGSRQYSPGTVVGRELVAHELTHTIQQQNASSLSLNRQLNVGKPGDPLEREADAVASQVTAGHAVTPSAITTRADGRIQRVSLGDLLSEGADWVGGTIAAGAERAWEGARWVGGRVAAGAEAAWEGAEWVGGKVAAGAERAWEGAKWFGGRALECARMTGRSLSNILTLNITSLADLVGIPKPAGGSPGAMDTILRVLRHPCLEMIPGYSRLLAATLRLEKVKSFLLLVDWITRNPGVIIEAIKGALGGLIAQIPDKARAIVRGAVAVNERMQEHLGGIWRHLEPKLEYLANNWWDVIKETGRDLLFPWERSGEDLSSIWEHIKSGASNLWDLEISKAVDDLLGIWRSVNSLAGRWYGWFLLASVLIGGVIGALGGGAAGGVGTAPAGGAGAAPGGLAGFIAGAGAGFEFAMAVGYVLLISMIAAETASIVKAGFDLATGDGTEDEKEEDYEQIASSSLALAITGAMILLGALAARFAKGLLARVRGLFQRRPWRKPTPAERYQAMKARRAEGARAQEIQDGIQRVDQELAAGTHNRPIPREDLDWLSADPRRKQLAYDDAIGSYRVSEARAALVAEQQGVLPRPVTRTVREPSADFIDGAGTRWSHKGTVPDTTVAEAVDTIVREAATGRNTLGDLLSMDPAKAALVRARVRLRLARIPDAGQVRFVSRGPEPAAIVTGVTGRQAAEQVEEVEVEQ